MRTAAIILVVAGILIVFGSSSDWVACSKEPCEEGGGLFHIYSRTGMTVGWGVLTTALGVLILVSALGTWRSLGLTVVTTAAAVGVLLVTAGFGARVWVFPEYDSYGPGFGYLLTVIGALIALGASAVPVIRRRSPTR